MRRYIEAAGMVLALPIIVAAIAAALVVEWALDEWPNILTAAGLLLVLNWLFVWSVR